ncbi:MAG: undecaprenyldiphospho-muramoylpentapeptide beta-N-acetylglucosaminyltransferase [Clostridia bacterium]|nr:undecaprenyldiphospho-muramoylpentapeptide beta-N-acetylglucosaminyltransferase [Clostridia bacterium]
MKVLFAGGGTAGHINPALSIADYMKEKEEDFEALFIGTERGLEKKLVPAAGYKIRYIDIRGFDRKNLLKNISVLYKLQKSRSDCKRIIKEFKPDAVICTGGYVSGPVAMAAKREGVPAIIHEQNVYPGLTVKGAEKYVDYVAVSFEETKEHMKNPHKCVVTGNPVRTEILNADKTEARAELGLSDKPFVLVFGGSLGAAKINETMIGVLKRMCEDKQISLLFGTGDRNFAEVSEKIKAEGIELGEDIKVVPYINNMSTAMAAADVVVARAGAITVSEIAALAKPSILIPSPNVVRNHQEQNAREFERNDAAVVITEDILTPDILYDKICEMTLDKMRLSQMSKNVKKLAKCEALEEIYQVVKKIINK